MFDKEMIKIGKALIAATLGIVFVVTALFFVSRYRAIAIADSYMKVNLREVHARIGCRLVLWTDGEWTPHWFVAYETESLTFSPYGAEVSLDGDLLRSYVPQHM